MVVGPESARSIQYWKEFQEEIMSGRKEPGDKSGAKRGAGVYSKNYLSGAKPQQGVARKYFVSPAEQAATREKVTHAIGKEKQGKGSYRNVGIDGPISPKGSGLPKFKKFKDWA